MLNRVIDFSVKNRLLIILALFALAIGALLILPKLKLDAFPDVMNVQVQVNTEAPGLAAKEVEQLITYPVEATMYSLPDVEQVRSISKTGLSVITVVFKEGTNIYFAREQVFQQLQKAKEDIPTGVGTPEIGPNTSGLGWIFQYILTTNNPKKYDVMKLRSLNDWVVKLQLLPVDGVTGILSFGGKVKQYQVQLNPQKLLSYKITATDVVRAIEDNNRNAGGWYLDRGNEQLVIRGEGWLQSGAKGLQEIANILVKEEHGTVVRVKNVAKVVFAPEIRQGAVSMMVRDENGKPKNLGEVVTGIVLKRIGANTKTTIEGIKKRLPAIQQALPEGVKIQAVYDQANLVNKAVEKGINKGIEQGVKEGAEEAQQVGSDVSISMAKSVGKKLAKALAKKLAKQVAKEIGEIAAKSVKDLPQQMQTDLKAAAKKIARNRLKSALKMTAIGAASNSGFIENISLSFASMFPKKNQHVIELLMEVLLSLLAMAATIEAGVSASGGSNSGTVLEDGADVADQSGNKIARMLKGIMSKMITNPARMMSYGQTAVGLGEAGTQVAMAVAQIKMSEIEKQMAESRPDMQENNSIAKIQDQIQAQDRKLFEELYKAIPTILADANSISAIFASAAQALSA